MDYRRRISIITLICILFSAVIPMRSLKVAAADKTATVYQADFEDGTMQDFGARGQGVQVDLTSAQAHGGSKSLLTSGRTDNWMGPQLDVKNKMVAGAQYRFSAWVRLAEDLPATDLKLSLQLEKSGAPTAYDQVAIGAANYGEWVKLEGAYTLQNAKDTILFYIESSGSKTVSYYMDDVLIEQLTPPPAETENPLPTQADFSFEDGTLQGWEGRSTGAVVPALSDEQTHSGLSSMKVTGRTNTWNGVQWEATSQLEAGVKYRLSAWVRLAEAVENGTDLKLSAQEDRGSNSDYVQISAETTTADGWTKLSGDYTLQSPVDRLLISVESVSNPTVSFYVDDISFDLVSVSYNFEDNGTQGWEPRANSTAVLDVTTEQAYEGSHSLKVSGRTDAWMGPNKSITSLLEAGATYDISLRVRLADESAPATKIMLSMESHKNGANYTNIGSGDASSAGWIELKGQYTLGGPVDSLLLYVEAQIDKTASFYVDDVEVNRVFVEPIQIQQDIPSLRDIYTNDFAIGAAITPEQISGVHGELLSKHYSSIVAENVMKPEVIQPSEGTFDWTGADALVNYAVENNKLVRGHTLVWHLQVGQWMFQDQGQPASKELLLERLKTHIETVMTRYKGKVYAWDVVNEVIDPNEADGFRRSPWYNIAGEEYIEKAFEYAHAVDPDAKLFINDFDTENPVKRQFLYNLVKKLKDKGVPIHGVGLQSHISINSPSVEQMEQTVKMFGELGMDVHITELDMTVYKNTSESYTDVPEDLLIDQAYKYKEIMDMLRRNKQYVKNVTFWGMGDDHTWLKTYPVARNDWPLLFDNRLQAKSAYWAMVDPAQVPERIQKYSAFGGTVSMNNGISPAVWEIAQSAPVSISGQSLQAEWKAEWDNQNMYMWIKVQDATINPGDKIELFIDQNNGKTTSMEADDKRYSLYIGDPSQPSELSYETVRTPDSYTVEVQIPISEAALRANGKIGFDMKVTDSDSSQHVIWNDRNGGMESDTSEWGTISFIPRPAMMEARPGTPQIDGAVDAVWSQSNLIKTDVWVSNTSGATAEIRTLWDAGNLYVLASVKDGNRYATSLNSYEQDSVEVFLDENHARAANYQTDDVQYRVNYENKSTFGGNPSDRFTSATSLTNEGYLVEMKIPFQTVQGQVGKIVGFDVQVNDDQDGNGTRDSVVIWNDPTGLSYQNTSLFGMLKLAPEASAPEASAPPEASTPSTPGSVKDLKGEVVSTDKLETADKQQTTVTLETKEEVIYLPANAADVLGSKSLKLKSSQAELTITSLTLAKLQSLLPQDKKDNAKIVVEMISLPKAQSALPDLVGHPSGFSYASAIMDLKLAIQDKNGKRYPLTEFKEGIELALQLDIAKMDEELTGIYYFNELTRKWEYIGGTVDSKGVIRTTVFHFSKYAALQMNKSYTDVPATHWASRAISVLSARHIVDGVDTNYYALNKPMTRAEFVKMLVQLLSINTVPTKQQFKDVEDNDWYSVYVNAAYEAGIIQGNGSHLFAPNRAITREEVASLLVKAVNVKGTIKNGNTSAIVAYKDQEDIAAWAIDSVRQAADLALLQGYPDGTFAPKRTLTRAEAAQSIWNGLIQMNP